MQQKQIFEMKMYHIHIHCTAPLTELEYGLDYGLWIMAWLIKKDF